MNAVVKPRGAQVVYARETLAEVRASGVDELLHRHWAEIAHYPDIPLDVDWEAYECAERSGALRAYTARMGREIIGYAAFLVKHNPHYKSSLQAVQDVLYLAPEHRGGRVGYRLMIFAEEQVRAEGTQAIYQHSKARRDIDIGPILARQGYEVIDHLWAKRLDRD